MAKVLSSLPIGSLIKDTGTLYNGKPIIWKIVDKNHSGYPSGAITLMTDRIISIKCFDAMEASNSDSDRRTHGNNRYIYSNIRRWLNSQNGAGAWYTAQHGQDAPPTRANVGYGENAYDMEAGFLTGFSEKMQNSLLKTTLIVGRNTVTDGGGYETCYDKIFLPSAAEMGIEKGIEKGIIEGSKFSAFNSDSSRLAFPTLECVSKSEYSNTSLKSSEPWRYWLRTPYDTNTFYVYTVYYSGILGVYFSSDPGHGVRPLCNLSSEILVTDISDSDNIYTIVWGNPPSTPSNINVPTVVRGGETIAISWGSSTDEDNNLTGYILERQFDNGSWTQLYKGINRTFTDLITFGWNSVAYRVKAYDSEGAGSEYQTSATRTVNNNTPPTISGSDGNLGLKTGAFNQTYVVTDVDSGQIITVVENMDGVQKRSYTATSGQSYSFNVNAAEWLKLLNGTHTMTITASDNLGGITTRTYTFTKNETEIELTLATPLPADDLVTKAIMSITRQIPAGAVFTVEACNNGNDAAPAWEDVTNAVLGNSKFFLSNTTKTAAAWGFNLRIKVKRNNATGDCFIISAGGNFE